MSSSNQLRGIGADKIKHLTELVEDIKVAMLTTQHGGGSLRSRPMMAQEVDKDGTLWFFTSQHGQVHDSISRHSAVNLSFSDATHNKFVSISGNATFVDNLEKIEKLWTPLAKGWFPEGPKDPNLALLRVEAVGAEYWDVKSGLMVELFGMVKAMITGKPFDRGDGETTQLAKSRKISKNDFHAMS